MAIQQEFARLAPNNRCEYVRQPSRGMNDQDANVVSLQPETTTLDPNEEVKVEKNQVVTAVLWGPERRKKITRNGHATTLTRSL